MSLDNALQAVQERAHEVARFQDTEVRDVQPCVRHNILDAEELAYCVNSFAMQWEVPE